MYYSLYGNGSSGNHGCEAIARGTFEVLGKEENRFAILADQVEQDRQVGLDRYAQLQSAKTELRKDARFLAAYAKLKLRGDYAAMDVLPYLDRIREQKGKTDLALSVGGDNYCYGGTELYRYLNQAYHDARIPTVLWGCSIEPSVVRQDKVREDLLLYNAVVARESITYEAVKAVQPNTVLAPDPAFRMPAASCEMDERFDAGNVIGLNISPMIVSNEKSKGMARANYEELLRFLLEETSSTVALIPHVVWPQNDDRAELRRLYELFPQKDRMILVEDHNAPELKYLISRCSFFIGARTHATIAAYSSCVPTLVVGYSVKARGIARDLFGTEKGYVVPVQGLSYETELREAFQALYSREEQIRGHLESMMPSYIAQTEAAREATERVVKNG